MGIEWEYLEVWWDLNWDTLRRDMYVYIYICIYKYNIIYIYSIYIQMYIFGRRYILQTKTMDSRYVVGATHQMRESPTTGLLLT